MKSNAVYSLVVLLSVAMNGMAHADWHVWTMTQTRHVLRSDPPGSDQAVEVSAARNEWVSFQVLLRSDEPVKAVCLEAGELRGPDGSLLRLSESRLYRQHQLHLEVGTYRNEAFEPDWYPDPLIPFQHPLPGRTLEAARLRAIPFDLAADETHGFWVDLYVPAGTPPGVYQGVYRVTAEGGKTVHVPVALTVWDFTLPRTPALVTAFGAPAQRMRSYHRERAAAGKEAEPADWPAVEAQCAQLMSDHRLNATPPTEVLQPIAQGDGSFRIPARQVRVLREFVDRYQVNALQIPHPAGVVKDPQTQGETLRAWLAAFDRAAGELDRPHVVFYIYLKDEPNTEEDYRYVQTWGRAIRQAQSIVQVLVVEQTWTEPGKGGADSAWGDLYGAVDIWCPLFSLHRRDSAAKRQTLGETIWTYTALCQGAPTPWWHIDFPLLNYRVPAWMAWRDGMKGLLYWGGMSHWRQTDDPWMRAPIYIGRGALQQGRKDILFNGEGSLVYPARAAGYDGIVPTVRLKALRDAVEDYEYLAMLSRRGKSAEAARVVRRLTDSWFQWDKDPAAYEKARAELAAMLVTKAAAQGPYPPSPVIADVVLDWSTHQRHAQGSDNFQLTWAEDDHQYGAWGDGGGFGGSNSEGRVGLGFARIEGSRDGYRGFNVWGGKDPENPAQFTGKSWGTICVDGILYSWIVPDNPDTGGPRDHYRYIELARSTDHGARWTKAHWRWRREDNLTIPTFLVYGKNNAGARDDYVYSYFIRPQDIDVTQSSFGLKVHKPGALFLARVHRNRLFDGRDAYEWFTGIRDGEPTWGLLSEKRPVFENPDGTGWCVSAGYNPGLARCLLATEHSASHSGVMSLFDAPEPWGPWTTVKYWTTSDRFGQSRPGSTLEWANNVFFFSFAPKWFSTDGCDFTLVFTGGGNGKDNDSMNTVRGAFRRRTPIMQ